MFEWRETFSMGQNTQSLSRKDLFDKWRMEKRMKKLIRDILSLVVGYLWTLFKHNYERAEINYILFTTHLIT